MTELGEIPNEWKVNTLGEISLGKGEYGIGASATEYMEGMPRYLRITDIGDNCRILFNDIKGLDDENYEKYILKHGDIVFARTGNTTGKGYAYEEKDGELVYAGFLIKFSINNKIAKSKFIKYIIQSKRYWDWVGVMSTRSGQPGINSNEYSSFNIQIPPIEEQEKIASILSTVDKQIDNVDVLIEKNKELKKGLMQQLLTKGIGHTKFKKTEIGEIPEEWEVNSKFINIKSGFGFKLKEYVYDGIPLIRINNVMYGKIIDDELSYLPEEYIESYKEFVLKKGDILLALNRPITNNRLKIGIVDKEPAMLYQRVGKLQFKTKKYLGEFFYQYMQSDKFIKALENTLVGSDQPYIKTSEFEKLKFPVPSIEEQQKIVSILSEVDKRIEEYENKKQKLEELKKGLMQRLLTGEIRVK